MTYNDNYFYNKLEINQIFELLKSYLILDVNKVDNLLQPSNDLEYLTIELAKVKEALDICVKFNRMPIYFNLDLLPILEMAKKGGILSGLDLFEIVHLFSSLIAGRRLLNNLQDAKVEVKFFENDINSLIYLESLDKTLRSSVDEGGIILDDATPELKKIRSRIKNLEERIKSKVIEIMNASKDYLVDSVFVKRDDRYCLCVKNEYKNVFRGIIRDTSSSALTVYMEPSVTFEMANEKDQLRNEEKEEVNRILKALSKEVGNYYEELSFDYHVFQELDIRFAKAMLARSYDGTMPHLNKKQNFILLNARHPLLKVDKVIPNSVSFGENHLGIVITGPNTGGKTVFLKTVGLVSLMVKFGLLIPADENSDIMIYDHVLADIGDDQSIQDNLSTFSSHMKKLVAIVNQVTPNSLALFDEIGSGTDPTEGAALAQGVLKYFIEHNISFIVTTHYAELKAFAYGTDKVINASMQFDRDTNNPTYKLLIGQSGSSNAFQTAKRLGLKREIVDIAYKSVSVSNSETRKLIRILEKQKDEVLKLKDSLNLELEKNQKLNEELNKRLKEIDNEKAKVLKAAKNEAVKVYQDAIKEANELVNELYELKNNMESSNVKLHEISDLKHKINEMNDNSGSLLTDDKVKHQEEHHKFKVGDNVYLEDYEQYGILNKIKKDGKCEVAIGNIVVNCDVQDLIYVKNSPEVKNPSVNVVMTENKHISLTLDLRGKRAYEAEELLDKYIDDLMMANIKSATIIHGFGTGAIREMVINYLKNSKDIKEYRFGNEAEGGYGVTVITLK